MAHVQQDHSLEPVTVALFTPLQATAGGCRSAACRGSSRPGGAVAQLGGRYRSRAAAPAGAPDRPTHVCRSTAGRHSSCVQLPGRTAGWGGGPSAARNRTSTGLQPPGERAVRCSLFNLERSLASALIGAQACRAQAGGRLPRVDWHLAQSCWLLLKEICCVLLPGMQPTHAAAASAKWCAAFFSGGFRPGAFYHLHVLAYQQPR